MRCKRHSHDYIMRCEVCLLEKMAVVAKAIRADLTAHRLVGIDRELYLELEEAG